jgi:hypothetical protein
MDRCLAVLHFARCKISGAGLKAQVNSWVDPRANGYARKYQRSIMQANRMAPPITTL